MRARQLLRSTFDTRWTKASQLPPIFLLPRRAQLHQASQTTHFQQTSSEIPPHSPTSVSPIQASTPSPSPASQPKIPSVPAGETSQTSSKPLVISKSLQQLLPVLHAQAPHYITAHLHRFPFLLTEGDTLRLPFHMKGVSIGDILRLNRASILGSRDYTLKAGLQGLPPNAQPTLKGTGDGSGEPPYLDDRLFVCRARVIGVDSGPMTIKEKTKRRQRRVKTVRSKHRYTVLKVMELRVKSLEELLQEGEKGETVILE